MIVWLGCCKDVKIGPYELGLEFDSCVKLEQ